MATWRRNAKVVRGVHARVARAATSHEAIRDGAQIMRDAPETFVMCAPRVRTLDGAPERRRARAPTELA